MSFGDIVHPANDDHKVLICLGFQAVGFSADAVRVGGPFIGDKFPFDQFINQCGYRGFAEMGAPGQLCA